MSRYNPTFFNPERWISIWWAAGETSPPPPSISPSHRRHPSLPLLLLLLHLFLLLTPLLSLLQKRWKSERTVVFWGEGGHILGGGGAGVSLTLRGAHQLGRSGRQERGD